MEAVFSFFFFSFFLQANADVKLDPVNQSMRRAECQREESGVLRCDAQLFSFASRRFSELRRGEECVSSSPSLTRGDDSVQELRHDEPPFRRR